MNNKDTMQNNFSPLYKGEREGVVDVALTPPRLPSYEGRKYAGFTLIELIIAIGIFVVFLTIIMGVFSRFVGTERHNIAQSTIISDVQSGLESFAKEVRTGYGSTYFGNEFAVAFRNQAGVCVIYRVENEVFERGEDSDNIEQEEDCEPELDLEFVPLTSNKTKITRINIIAEPAEIADEDTGRLGNQGTVAIELTADSATTDIAPLNIQRTITSRQLAAYKTIAP